MKTLRTALAAVFVLCVIVLVLGLTVARPLCTGGDERAGYPYIGDREFQVLPLGYRCVYVSTSGARRVVDPGYFSTGALVVMTLCALGWLAAHRRDRQDFAEQLAEPS